MRELINNCIVEDNIVVGFYDEFEEDLIIPDGVIAIWDNAFAKYYGLKTVKFPNTLQEIGVKAFENCSNLRKVVLPESVINLKKGYFGNTFSECKQLVEADLSKTQIQVLYGGTFWNCKKLQMVKLPQTLIKIEQDAFWSCINLTAIEFNEGLKVIECDFKAQKHMSILNIPKSVIHIEDLSGNENINTVVLSRSQYEVFKEYLPPHSKIIFKE